MSAAALMLALSGSPASAAGERLLTDDGTDPSAAAGAVAWQLPGGGSGFIRRDGATPQTLPGSDPALGPDNIVWREGGSLVVADQSTLGERLRIAAPGAEEPAVSARWLVWPARENTSDVLRVVDLQAPAEPPVTLRSVPAPGRIGRPSIDADRAVYHVALRDESKIQDIYLPTRRRAMLRRGRASQQLLNPSELGGSLLFVRASSERQQVLIGPRRARRGDRDRSLYTIRRTVRPDAGHDRGRKPHAEGYPGGRPPRRPARPTKGRAVTLWSTALAPDAAYVSRLRRTATGATTVILTLPR